MKIKTATERRYAVLVTDDKLIRPRIRARSMPMSSLYLLMGVAISSVSSESLAANNKIEVVNEILLEGGSAVEPSAIQKTHSGGYVIAGSMGRPWATRVDAAGKVQWRYESRVDELHKGSYAGIAVLPDDSVLLCGSQNVLEKSFNKTQGLLTHLDKAGNILSEQLIEPNGDDRYTTSHLTACIVIGNEVLLLGDTYLKEAKSTTGWSLTLDAKIAIKNEKFFSGFVGDPKSVQLMPNMDVVMSSMMWASPIKNGSTHVETMITRMAINGDAKAEMTYPTEVMQAISVNSDSTVRLAPWSSVSIFLSSFDENLKERGQKRGSVKGIISKKAYYMPDGSLVLFGGHEYEDDSFTASISVVSVDLTTISELILKPTLGSDAIVDAVPTGSAGEFATIRSVGPSSHLLSPNETRLGAVLSFVQIKQ